MTTTTTTSTTDMTPTGDFATPAQVEAILHDATAALVREEDDQIVGTCPICFRAHVLDVSATFATDGFRPSAAIMVRHGWREVGRRVGEYGLGQQFGACSGVGAPAFELSRKATLPHLANLKTALDNVTGRLALLDKAPPSMISIPARRRGEEATEVFPGTYDYDCALRDMKYRARQERDSLQAAVTEIGRAVAEWAPSALRTKSGIAPGHLKAREARVLGGAERAEIEARAAERKAKSSAKANATAERKAAAEAKLAAKLAPVLAAMAAEPSRFFSVDEIQTLAKTSKQGKFTEAQLWSLSYGVPLKQDGFNDAYQLRAK